jgi:uncharacterized protein (DUF983 family)
MRKLDTDFDNPAVRALVLTERALRLRCPHCGAGPIFATWFRMHERCPGCGFRLERGEQGYIVGAYMFNIIAAVLLFAAAFVGFLWVTWPDTPWTTLQYGTAALMILCPILCYPFSKTLFLAFDLYFRPVRPEDLDPTLTRAV